MIELSEDVRKQLVEEYRLGTLPEKECDQALSLIGESILQKALQTAFEKLSEGQKEEVERMLENNAPQEAIGAFLSDALPEYGEMYVNATVEFKKEYDERFPKS